MVRTVFYLRIALCDFALIYRYFAGVNINKINIFFDLQLFTFGVDGFDILRLRFVEIGVITIRAMV